MNRTIIRFPFPLDDETIIHLELPEDLTAREADRLGAYIKAIPSKSGTEEQT